MYLLYIFLLVLASLFLLFPITPADYHYIKKILFVVVLYVFMEQFYFTGTQSPINAKLSGIWEIQNEFNKVIDGGKPPTPHPTPHHNPPNIRHITGVSLRSVLYSIKINAKMLKCKNLYYQPKKACTGKVKSSLFYLTLFPCL